MARRLLLSCLVAGSLALAACGGDDGDAASSTTAAGEAGAGGAGASCAQGKTLEDGVLTIATGDPAFEPWVVNDDPESGEGFEAAVAYAVAEQLGFERSAVTWVRTSFDEAIQPGPKRFDFNLQQYSISPEREEVVSFSRPYYATNQAVVGFEDSAAAGATSAADLAKLKLGAAAGTTSLTFIEQVIKPSTAPYAYNDNTDAKAALESKQIDAIVLDLPTAFFVSAVEIEGTTVIGQFPADAGGATDEFGLLFEKDNPLVACVDEAIGVLEADGTLEQLTAEWLADKTGAKVLSV